MNKENQKDKENLICLDEKQQFLKKEIIYDIDKDKYYLYNKENNKINQINSFGKKKAKINNAQVGKASYNERLKSKSIDKINNKIDDSLYHPRMKYFDRFSQIPRPLVKPFTNDNDIILQSKSDIFNYIKNKKFIISTQKNHNLFNKNNENIHELDYYSGTIAGDIINNNKNNIENKNKVLKDIDEKINNKELNKNEIDLINIFKKNLLNNSRNIIDGKELNKPKDIFKNRYTINHNVMFINPIKNLSINKDLLINLNIYHILYKSINNNNITSLKNKNIINEIHQHFYNKINDFGKNKKQYKLGRPKSVINIKAKNKLDNINNSNTIIKRNNYFFLPEKKIIEKNEAKRYDTEDDYIDIYNNQNIINNKVIIKNSNSKSTGDLKSRNKKIIKYNYNNFNGSKSASDILLKNNNNIHSFIDLKKNYKIEKKLLNGYQKPFIKEIPILRKGIPKYKSTGELYKKELDMFKLVNPDKLKSEEDENNKRINFLKKKIEKEKIVQIVKYKHLIDKKSRIHSAVSNIGKEFNDV